MRQSEQTKNRTRIQERNETRIISCALDVFSRFGYRGATVDQIAAASGMSKANVLYYFKTKQDIYVAVLERTVAVWLDPLDSLDADGDPITELWRYVEQKLALSRDAPHASRLFANEILQGAPIIKTFLETELKTLVTQKCQTIQAWIDQGKIAPVDPLNLLFLIWSSTQHYADFRPQIDALTELDEDALYKQATHTLRLLITQGLRPNDNQKEP